jgi:prepilin-type N-terminal cleavage/methylation domain-containing protein
MTAIWIAMVRDTRAGFTLLEALITIVILTIVTVGLLWALNIGLFARSGAESIAVAMNIARAKMEDIRNTPYVNIQNNGPTPDSNFPYLNVTVTAVNAQNIANLKQLDISVSWQTKGGQENVTLTTFVANNY